MNIVYYDNQYLNFYRNDDIVLGKNKLINLKKKNHDQLIL